MSVDGRTSWWKSTDPYINDQVSEVHGYQFQEPFVMDTSKLENTSKYTVMAYDTAIRETLDWHRTR